MKAMIMVLGLLVSISLLANGNRPIKNEIEHKLSMNLNEFNFHEEIQDFVVVRFTIEEQKIKIDEIMGSDPWLINSLKQQLSTMVLENKYPDQETYNFKFVFEKR